MHKYSFIHPLSLWKFTVKLGDIILLYELNTDQKYFIIDFTPTFFFTFILAASFQLIYIISFLGPILFTFSMNLAMQQTQIILKFAYLSQNMYVVITPCLSQGRLLLDLSGTNNGMKTLGPLKWGIPEK